MLGGGMKLSISKLALLFGTPIVLLGYQNCAKLGTDNLIGGSSGFVSSGSTEIASTQSSADAADEASTPAPQEVAAQKPKVPSVDPSGKSKFLLANAWKTCRQPAALAQMPDGEFKVQTCLNLFCQAETGNSMCTALLQIQKSYTL
jgi:hypothetical protein